MDHLTHYAARVCDIISRGRPPFRRFPPCVENSWKVDPGLPYSLCGTAINTCVPGTAASPVTLDHPVMLSGT